MYKENSLKKMLVAVGICYGANKLRLQAPTPRLRVPELLVLPKTNRKW